MWTLATMIATLHLHLFGTIEEVNALRGGGARCRKEYGSGLCYKACTPLQVAAACTLVDHIRLGV